MLGRGFLALVLVGLVAALLPTAAPAATTCTLSGKRGYNSGNAGPTDYRFYVRPRGAIDVAVIFADFADAPGNGIPTQQVYDSAIPGADAYLRTASHNRMSLRVSVRHGWVRMPWRSSAYGFHKESPPANTDWWYLADAITAANPDLDFSNTDVVIVFASPRVKFIAGWATILGPRVGFARADGRTLGFGITFGNDMYDENGAPYEPEATPSVVHELLHTFGLPDLYRIGGNELDIGVWDPMSEHRARFGLTAWHLRKLGWLPARNVTCLERRRSRRPRTITATLRPLGTGIGRQALILPLTRTRAWVIESRQKVGLDREICRPGVLVYSVDAARAGDGDAPIRALPASTKTSERCGELANATYSVGPGRRSTAHHPRTGLTVKVLRDSISGSRVRVTLRR